MICSQPKLGPRRFTNIIFLYPLRIYDEVFAEGVPSSKLLKLDSSSINHGY